MSLLRRALVTLPSTLARSAAAAAPAHRALHTLKNRHVAQRRIPLHAPTRNMSAAAAAAAASSGPSVPAPPSPSTVQVGAQRDVGILAMDMYFPKQFVGQPELEQFNGVSAGKYTIGLGQSKMAFCTDREDIYSVCLSGQ